MPKVVIFASGTGSNAEEIVRFLQEKNSSVEVVTFLTNKKEAGIYLVSKRKNIPIQLFSNQEFLNVDKVIEYLKSKKVEWIILAGFLRKVEPKLIREFENRIINIHPSLLPKYGGKGMYGKYVHQSILENKEQESGITIHLVNEEFDKGKIIFQAKCKIVKGQTVEQLTKNIQKLEHEFFAKTIEEYILENCKS